MNPTNYLDGLFVERRTFAEEIAQEAKGFLHIDVEDCIPILPISLDDLTSSERILLELVTRYLCSIRDGTDSAVVTRERLQRRCRLSDTALRARLSDLRKLDLISSENNGERVTMAGLIEFRDKLRKWKVEYDGGG